MKTKMRFLWVVEFKFDSGEWAPCNDRFYYSRTDAREAQKQEKVIDNRLPTRVRRYISEDDMPDFAF